MASSKAAGKLFAKIGNRDGVAQTAMARADLYVRLGDRNSAKKMFDEALASYKASGNERGAAAALSNLGALRGYEGDWSGADKTHRVALATFRKVQSKRGVADALNNFAFTQMSEGNLAAARSMFEESLAIFRDIDDQGGLPCRPATSREYFGSKEIWREPRRAASRHSGLCTVCRIRISFPVFCRRWGNPNVARPAQGSAK